MSLLIENEKIENNKLGIAAFFYSNIKNEEIDRILLEDFILAQKFPRFSNQIKQKRNNLIYLSGLQVLSSIIGMFYMVLRRSYIYLVINLLTILLAFSGFYGAVRMHYLYLIIHCIFTVSLTGGFFFYQFVDFFLVSDTTNGDTRRSSDSVILLIFSLPYLFDFIVGIYCYFFLKSVSKENEVLKGDHEKLKEEIDEINNKVSFDQITDKIKNINSEICVICMVNRRNTAFNPCGHYLSCEECSNELFNKYIFAKPTCPICRKVCQSFIKVIVS